MSGRVYQTKGDCLSSAMTLSAFLGVVHGIFIIYRQERVATKGGGGMHLAGQRTTASEPHLLIRKCNREVLLSNSGERKRENNVMKQEGGVVENAV